MAKAQRRARSIAGQVSRSTSGKSSRVFPSNNEGRDGEQKVLEITGDGLYFLAKHMGEWYKAPMTKIVKGA